MSDSSKLVIVGRSGHARELTALIHDINRAKPQFTILGHIVTRPEYFEPGVPGLLGDLDWLLKNLAEVDGLVLGIGYPKPRQEALAALQNLGLPLHFPSLIHPSVLYQPSETHIGAGSIIAAGCVLTMHISIGSMVVVNPNCTISHDTKVGDGSSIFASAAIAGGVTIGRECMIGIGSRIVENIRIGDGAQVGAGSLVLRDVPAGELVYGVPARRPERRQGGDEASPTLTSP